MGESDSALGHFRNIAEGRVGDSFPRKVAEALHMVVHDDDQIDGARKRRVEIREVELAVLVSPDADLGEKITGREQPVTKRPGENRLEVVVVALGTDEHDMPDPLLGSTVAHDGL